MTAQRDTDRLINAFLMEGQTELADPVFDAVRATIEHKRQRTVYGPWRLPNAMNKLVPFGLGAAAVVVALVIGMQVFGPAAPGGVGGPPSPTPTASPSPKPFWRMRMCRSSSTTSASTSRPSPPDHA